MNAHKGWKHRAHRGETVAAPSRPGEGERITLVGETVGDTATVAARLKGGGTFRSGVATGDAPDVEAAFPERFNETDRMGSRPSPRVADKMGVLTPVLKPVEAGEPRLAVLPGMTGKLDLRSGTGAAAIPSQIMSSMG